VIEVPFGVISKVGPGIGVLDGVHTPHPPMTRGGFSVGLLVLDLPLRRWRRNVFRSCEKFDKISVQTVYRWKHLFVGFLVM